MDHKELYMKHAKIQDSKAIRNLRYAIDAPHYSVVNYVSRVIHSKHEKGLNNWPRIVY